MGYPFHLGDTFVSTEELKPIIFAIVLLTSWNGPLKNERCTAHVLICSCHADTYGTLAQLDQESDCSEYVYKKLSLIADNSCIAPLK